MSKMERSQSDLLVGPAPAPNWLAAINFDWDLLEPISRRRGPAETEMFKLKIPALISVTLYTPLQPSISNQKPPQSILIQSNSIHLIQIQLIKLNESNLIELTRFISSASDPNQVLSINSILNFNSIKSNSTNQLKWIKFDRINPIYQLSQWSEPSSVS